MRILRYVLPFLLAMSGALVAAENVDLNNPASEYDRAVKAYVDAASDQLHAIRGQLDALAGTPPTDAAKTRLAKAYARLDDCDRLLAELKKAGPPDFDRVKAQFEKTRATLIEEFDRAGKS